MQDAEKTILAAIDSLLQRRGATGIEVTPSSHLSDDLELDSLELAELSAALEDDLGRDPFTDGILPDTVSELVGFYNP